jgi:hypothetical protein
MENNDKNTPMTQSCKIAVMPRLSKNKILKLRPEFKIGSGMSMIEWFEITEGGSFFCIKSGLRHADGETKSPYHYEDCVGGKNAEKIALDKFNLWWCSLNEA